MLALLVALATASCLTAVSGAELGSRLPSVKAEDDTCAHLLNRQDCGYVGISKDECAQRQCCWSPSMMPVPWCFQKKAQDYLCTADVASRRDCGFVGISAQECSNRNCCWDSDKKGFNAPFCFMKQYPCKGYSVQNVEETDHGLAIDITNGGEDCARYGKDIPNLRALIDFETESRVRVKIIDKDAARYEVPVDTLPTTDSSIRRVEESKRAYKFSYTKSPFSFAVTRVSNGEVLFDSKVAGMDPLVYEDEYLEISTALPKDANIYGLGEVVSRFRRDTSGTRQALWSRDAATPVDENLYGSHPFYLEMRGNGTAHGVFLRSSNGMDVIMTPGKLTYKLIGGIVDLTVFLGPSPKDVVNQYTEVIGRPMMPPAWSLGFHQSRWGYKNLNAVQEYIDTYKQNNLPLDGAWIDIDYMEDFKDFTFDETRFPQAKVRELAQNLSASHQSLILIVDPGIPLEPGYEPYDIGMRDEVFIRTATGKPVEGRVWPGQTYYPDFFNSNETWTWWRNSLGKTKDDIGDNVYPWIDMNEPSNFCHGPCTKDGPIVEEDSEAPSSPNLKYAINNAGNQSPLNLKTIVDNAFHKNGLRMWDTHNLYGHMQSKATYDALEKLKPGVRPFLLTRSSFAGTGAYSAHWTGDNWSKWDHLHYSISGILSFGLFGVPFTGSDICGFIGNTTEELCSRWHQLGSLYPFSRNHNDIKGNSQEPYVWPNTVLPIARQSLETRYKLLPYTYTHFRDAHKSGTPVWQPLFFKFPLDETTLAIDTQFLLGDSIMVSPALFEGQVQVKSYFPGNGRWFDFYSLQCIMESSKNGDKSNRYKFLKAKAGVDPIAMSIAGGSIIPTQNPMMTVAETRLQPLSLIIALDDVGSAMGEMYVDDGISIDNAEQATIKWELNLGQQLKSQASVQSPSGNIKSTLSHSDKIEKITIGGLNFARHGGEHGPGPKTAGGWNTQFKHHRRDLAEANGVPENNHRQTNFEAVAEQKPKHVPILPNASEGNAKVSALTELNVNGAVIPVSGGLNGVNGTQGQDAATGVAWSVDQKEGTLTLSGLKFDLFAEWFINWKLQ
ncbi:hypothetical protein BGZ76_007668 [Entomortierella beljakovae]|nr:hypothetical protein BGZ76_007668 [Entomortierella beljakovae]